MDVITIRQELIEFYEQRNYIRTGIIQEFPANPKIWQPRRDGLRFEKLEKVIATPESFVHILHGENNL